MPPRPQPPPESEIEESFLKGSGPGGQKINKTSSAVQLKHKPTGIVVKSQATRSRSQNRTIARQLLAERLDDLARGDASRSAIVGAFRSKKKASAGKKSRRKYRKLAEEAGAGAAGEGEEEEEGEVGEEGEEEARDRISRFAQEEEEKGEGGRDGDTNIRREGKEEMEVEVDVDVHQHVEPSRSKKTPPDEGR
ncbi:hypothetical protein SLS62_008140 [Diatrype stigma]|uniref:Prokaryotic-type class I peptide chain release factors domain-containing protein n=1 Tax=Diatrype stigma TaxID=117547 RepID=A0AAN9UK37_9PEZI